MQKIEIVCVGKLKEKFFSEACAEYMKRLSAFAKVEIKEIPEGRSLREEAEGILRASTGYKVALCVEGTKLSSEGLAAKMKGLCDEGKAVTFIIGSSEGLDAAVKDAADFRLSFSDMTFPHQLMRVVLLEQIYRSFMINSGRTYHK
ncbi:MAG: 23S rRNA (pseudouridine(1915)-N(3))-methyltransferase RlmH [Clostridia bacterium]|nr:23S rRNA (pseudouridine(1915)-N(3))-methyltransferase RlmH [Clostridia bacterium]